LGGLAAGIALKSLGYKTTVLERNPNVLLQDQGAGIVAGGDSLEFFRRYNRCKRPIDVKSKLRQYLDKDGNVIHTIDVVQSMSSVGSRAVRMEIQSRGLMLIIWVQWDLTYHMMRANYDGLESEYCDVPPADATHGEADHQHDRNVTALTEEGDGVRVFWRTAAGTEGSILADTVIGADGPSSTIRSLFAPGVQRTYAGYCALRGTVPEHVVSTATQQALCETWTFFHAPGVQILTYLIPGVAGTVEPGKRLINFVYYRNFPAGSAELDDILTDRDGVRRHLTTPPGMMPAATWAKQAAIARAALPPPLAEVVCATTKPFVQAVTDVLAPDHEFLGGKVVLLGDALAGFRPHTVASTSQAALDAMLLADYVDGGLAREAWRRQTMGYARYIQRRGVEMGNRSQFQRLDVHEYIKDRDVASTPREEEVYPDWAVSGL